MKYQPGTKWNRTPTAEQEAKEFHDYVQALLKKLETDPHAGDDLMQRAGIWDENCQPTEKYRDPNPS